MSDSERLLARLDGLAGARVLVLGDVMLDGYVHGAAERISPEGPIPVLRIEREEAVPGGAANVARNVAALGGTAILVGLVGSDATARQLNDLLAAEPRIAARLVAEPGRVTTRKTRFVAGRQQLLRADAERASPCAPDTAQRLLEAYGAALAEVDAVILSDYAKGVLAGSVVAEAIARAAAAGKPVLVDPKSDDLARYRGATLLTPNRHELAQAARLPCDDDEGAAAAARAILAEAGVGALLVTRGEQGMTLVAVDGAPLHLRAEAREVFEVTGAGDTVVATVAVALARGWDLADAARLANAAGGIVVGKLGTAVAHPAELRRALQTEAVMSSEAKVVGLDRALEQAARWRSRGERIGFTNGCFDLIHPGHVALLSQARAACDRLIVGLNTDESVARLKGPGRPIQNGTARAIVLASLSVVDLVVPFEEDTPIGLIGRLRPDVLVKGADYRLEEVVGADLVRGYGGRVLLVELVPGQSTTGTIGRVGRATRTGS